MQEDAVTGELTPEAQAIDETKGDDFVSNVNSGSGPARKFISVQGTITGGKIYSTRSIRPLITADPDGVGLYSGSEFTGDPTAFNASTQPAAMGIDGTTCPGLTAAQCRDKYMKWLVGLDNGTVYSRCPVPGGSDCNLVGDVYHSTPRIVGRPNEFLADESYTRFSTNNSKRPIVMYTSTNDGFLHAFKVASGDPPNDSLKVDQKENNELWAFMPPAVLPSVSAEYPGTHQNLLDGLPVVKDVVAKKVNGTYKFERSPADARSGLGTWRTVLVQGFGGNRGGYFAVDVTDPVAGPTFLWQLTEDSSGNPLFGKTSSTPLITTLYFDTGNGDPKEVAVAVLPGGDAAPTGGSCNRKDPSPDGVDSSFAPRGAVRCYPGGAAGGGARSLTIVRLDTGEIVRSFRRDSSEAPPGLAGANRIVDSPIDSPITGVPVAFPGTTGAVADRVFVGDRDGTLWRVDLSSTNPSSWSMKLFFDAYPGLLHNYDDGQPIQTPPILSVDILGNVTAAFSTGDQDVLTAPPGMKNYVYSLTEKVDATGTKFTSKVNWYESFANGERVAGPMTLFNGALFFSTFSPEPTGTTQVCKAGSSRVWGMDYLDPKEPGDLSQGGRARLPDGASVVQFIDSTSTLLKDGAIIFGVGVTQLPSCTDEVNQTDPYFGSGTHTSISTVAPGKFQLVMHTGNVGDSVLGGKSNKLEIRSPDAPQHHAD